MFVVYLDSIVEHWESATSLTLADTVSKRVTACHSDTVDIDMSEIRAENERKLAAMTEQEIVARQRELLSGLGQYSFIFSFTYYILCTPLSF